jgi:hypothetical protein
MSPLRIAGYAGLVVLSAAALVHLVLSFGRSDWYAVAFGVGALVLAAFLGDQLRVAGVEQRHPGVEAAPSRILKGLLLAMLGAFTGVTSAESFMAASWLAAALTLAMAVILLERACRALLK